MSYHRALTGMSCGGELGGQLPEFRFVLIAPAALVIAQRPRRRQRGPAGQGRVTPDHLGQRRTGEHVDVGDAAEGLIPELARPTLAGVHDSSAGIVEKQSQKPLALFEDGEGNGDVGGIVIVAGVGVAEHRHHVHGHAVGAVAQFVETPGAFPKPVAPIDSGQAEVEQQVLAATADALGDGEQAEAGQFQPQAGQRQFDPSRRHREHRR